MFDSQTIRFLQVDPYSEEFLDIHPYVPFHDNPISRVDPTGGIDTVVVEADRPNPEMDRQQKLDLAINLLSAAAFVATLPEGGSGAFAVQAAGRFVGRYLISEAVKDVSQTLSLAKKGPKDLKKLTDEEVGKLLKELGYSKNGKWHQDGSKKKFISENNDNLKGENNPDFYIDNNTKEVFLKGTNNKNLGSL